MSAILSDAPELLTRQEAAAYLNCRPQTLALWASTGRYSLPMVKVGRLVRYRRTSLDDFLERRTVTSTGVSENVRECPRESKR